MGRLIFTLQDTLEVTMGGTTFTVTGASAVGLDQTGRAYAVDGGSGITVTAISPAQTTDGSGDIINGLMLNPSVSDVANAAAPQGLDERYSTWDGLLNQTLPVAMSAGDRLLKAVSGATVGTRSGDFTEFACLHCVTTAPTSTQVLRSTLTWTGTDEEPELYTADMDAFFAGLTPLDSGILTLQSYATTLTYAGTLWPFALTTTKSATTGYESFSPPMGDYSEDLERRGADVLFYVLSDAGTSEQRMTLARKLLMHGIEVGLPLLYAPNNTNTDGGHEQWYQGPTVFALPIIGKGAELANVYSKIGGAWKAAVELTSGRLSTMQNSHASASLPYALRERTLPAQPGGSVVRLPIIVTDFTTPGGENDPRRGAGFRVGQRVVRKSDGQEAVIATAANWSNEVFTGNIDVTLTGTSPFAEGDVVYLKPEYELAQVGHILFLNIGWVDANSKNGLDFYGSDYLGNARWGSTITAIKALDENHSSLTFWHSDFNVPLKFAEQASLDNYPVSGNDISSISSATAVAVRAANTSWQATSAPDAFVLADWTLASNGTVTINAMPNCNGIASESVEYRLDGGTWTDSGLTSDFTTTFVIPSYAGENAVEIRAVNRRGGGTESDIKTA